jgi:hypothetical protein
MGRRAHLFETVFGRRHFPFTLAGLGLAVIEVHDVLAQHDLATMNWRDIAWLTVKASSLALAGTFGRFLVSTRQDAPSDERRKEDLPVDSSTRPPSP